MTWAVSKCTKKGICFTAQIRTDKKEAAAIYSGSSFFNLDAYRRYQNIRTIIQGKRI
jgi:hypothetical protein